MESADVIGTAGAAKSPGHMSLCAHGMQRVVDPAGNWSATDMALLA